MASVAGWNAGKQQELKDRVRYDPFDLAAVPAPAPVPAKVQPPAPVPLVPVEVAD